MSRIKTRVDAEDGFLVVYLPFVTERETHKNLCYQSDGTQCKRKILPEHLQIKVNFFSESRIAAETVLGNLWPPAVYGRAKSRKIPKGALASITIAGVTHTAIALPPSEGEPIGVR